MTNVPHHRPHVPAGRGLLAGKTVLDHRRRGHRHRLRDRQARASKRARASSSATSTSAGSARRAEQLGTDAHAILGNVTVEDDVQRLVDEAVEFGGGRLDVLVNNAGLGGTATLAEMTDEQWFSVLDVTLTGTMRMTRAALRHMRGAGRGRDREQRLGRRLARPGRPVALRGREGRRHGADPLRRDRGRGRTTCASTRSRRRSRCTRSSPRSRPRSCSPSSRPARRSGAPPSRGRSRT